VSHLWIEVVVYFLHIPIEGYYTNVAGTTITLETKEELRVAGWMAGIEDDVVGNNDSGTIKGPVEVIGVDVHETSVWIVFSSRTCGCLLVESSIVEED
jgi:hypothetical protein